MVELLLGQRRWLALRGSSGLGRPGGCVEVAMGWCLSVAGSHARRLERQGWVERHRMTRGVGSLLVATRPTTLVIIRRSSRS